MVVILHFKLYPALFLLKWLISIPNISAVRGNVVFETLHDFYRTAIISFMENPDKTWEDRLERDVQKAPPQPILFS